MFISINWFLKIYIPQTMTPKSVSLQKWPTLGTLGHFRSLIWHFCHDFMAFWPFELCESIFLTICAYFGIQILIKHSRKFVNCLLGMFPSIFWPSVPRVLLCIKYPLKYIDSWLSILEVDSQVECWRLRIYEVVIAPNMVGWN